MWIFIQRDISVTDRKMIRDLIYGYSKPLEKASYYTKSKGRKEESIGRVFKKLILVKLSYTWNNYFEITLMFSVQSLLVGNGTSVTCLRKTREPITALNVATFVTPLMVRNFWLWAEILNFLALFLWEVLKFLTKWVLLLKVAWWKEAFVQRKFSTTAWSLSFEKEISLITSKQL